MITLKCDVYNKNDKKDSIREIGIFNETYVHVWI